MNEQTLKSNRRQLIIIMLVALVSLGGSYLAFYVASTQGGWGTTNNGEFVDPPMQIDNLGWQVESGDQGVWWLWSVVEADCDPACEQMIKDMRALHILLGREAGRVRRGFTSLNGVAAPQLEAYVKLQSVSIDQTKGLKEGLYIVDPNGNLVFFYAPMTNPKLILEDLKKMLKVSQIG